MVLKLSVVYYIVGVARVTLVTFPSVCSTNISPVGRPGVKMKIYILIIRVNLAIKLFLPAS